MCVRKVLRLSIYLLVIMLALASAREFVDKRSPQDHKTWLTSSRYGRSSGQSTGNAARHVVVTARRDDRFRPVSRYGKRTIGYTDFDSDLQGVTQEHQDVQCAYTGVADLYRCHVHVRKENTSDESLIN